MQAAINAPGYTFEGFVESLCQLYAITIGPTIVLGRYRFLKSVSLFGIIFGFSKVGSVFDFSKIAISVRFFVFFREFFCAQY